MVRGAPSRPVELPVPCADVWDWQLHGLCRGYDSSVFFHPEGERGRARALREKKAKAVCGRCPVLAQCRSHALSANEPYGVWGGMSAHDRADYYRTESTPA
ncbi:WhiB family transcriptional regulator [Rhodococcus sp. BP-252]|uniref:Transcriptional regulator WhiB n=1 Tax=Rhodococcoides kyotonense TaxID=398843 RepID=A0A177YK17_9NOCA|nr:MULTISPECIES: WhiB family transcriptional regulator [Rhodococcus]MBY6413203.1 WhiB family transcriptional regulator [Rhodococcus sp. BP-320]MBY6418682.1 WhiB family transcriptional regulator [Rhodococcus sp. BP-321]MBY6422976.1 WhiB family transcriptional regulator [Rhodococcus sp. BP-324]MBY6427946.1 WhiB family transcriptional regulator [Rhodococcus sp. BP-323]MBY6433124.1 WhiB family transcriptional regulator [Rhodococcus sp. BP-322]